MMHNSIANINPEMAIVIMAYNRINSLKRLISSILSAEYSGDGVDLIVSIDLSDTRDVIDYAKTINWKHGKLIIIEQEVRLGLKQHVLKCGNITRNYSAICVFEDDLYVSPNFYNFAKLAFTHFEKIECIAGVSMYTHQWNPYVNRPFTPVQDGFDVYLMQIASSWGQIWWEKDWSQFIEWLANKTDEDLHSYYLPKEVANWSTKSWLKFHNGYLVEENKFFVYPREALSTNFSDAGEHAVENTTYQIPILIKSKLQYNFPISINEFTQYDAFFENLNYSKYLKIDHEDLDVNLYGNKPTSKKFVLTTQNLQFKKIKSFGLKMRPIDLNIIFNITGDTIYLYDTSIKVNKKSFFNRNYYKKILYDLRTESKKELFFASMILYYRAFLHRIGNLF